jgi:hypothetical protein
MLASVPLDVIRSISTDGMRRVTSSARSTSPAVAAPNVVPWAAAVWTASTIAGCAWPWMSGPQDITQST